MYIVPAKMIIKRCRWIMFKVMNEFKNANKARTICFTESLSNELQDVADPNDVSFNTLVLQCCRYTLDHMENKWD